MSYPEIPDGFGVPLIDLSTDLLPAPTMAALDERYAAEAGPVEESYVDYVVSLTATGLTAQSFTARKFASGRVELFGLITNTTASTVAALTTIGNVPAAIRPARIVRGSGTNQGNTAAFAFAIEPDGDVVTQGAWGAAAAIGLEGFNFLAADSL